MTTLHKVKCDACKKTANLHWNGQHWLSPKDWVVLVDHETHYETGDHLCPKCRPESKGYKRPKDSK